MHECIVIRLWSDYNSHEKDDSGDLDGFKRLTIVFIRVIMCDENTIYFQILINAHEYKFIILKLYIYISTLLLYEHVVVQQRMDGLRNA